MTTAAVAGSAVTASMARPAPAGALTRLTVQGPGGPIDLAVPSDATSKGVLDALGPEVDGLELTRSTGRALDPGTSLLAQHVRDGDLLVLALPGAMPPAPESASRRHRAPERRSVPGAVVLLPGALALAGIAAGTAFEADALARVAIAAGIALAAALVALLPRSARLPAGSEALAPAFAAAATVALLPRTEPGADLLVIVAAGVVAAQVAAVIRMIAGPLAQAALRIWLWSGVIVAGVGAGVMAGDGAPRAVWAVLALFAVAGAKLLPQIAVDVPDEQLLDADRMAATTWSARVVPPARRVRVRSREVVRTVEAGRRLLEAGAFAVALTAAGTAVALAVDPGPGWTRWLAFATGGLIGVALAVSSRAYRGVGTRIALRAGGLVAALAGAGGALAASSDAARYSIAGGCVLLAVPALFAAAALGNGWRSVWWARLGDGVESLAGAAAFPVALLAGGTFEHFRALLS